MSALEKCHHGAVLGKKEKSEGCTFCVIHPDFKEILHPCFVSYTKSHVVSYTFYSKIFCHTPTLTSNHLNNLPNN